MVSPIGEPVRGIKNAPSDLLHCTFFFQFGQNCRHSVAQRMRRRPDGCDAYFSTLIFKSSNAVILNKLSDIKHTRDLNFQ